MIIIETEKEFNKILELPKAIIYLHVKWSIYERFSWSVITKAFDEIKPLKTPVYKIDCTDCNHAYIDNWLFKHQKELHYFQCGGSGETLLVENGTITEFIRYPGHWEFLKVKETIKSWQT